jgi:FkbM family methyltransferase
MKFLKLLRSNKIINRFFRTALKKSSALSINIHSNLIKRWPPSGVIDCNFGPYKFKYFNNCDDGLTNYFYYDLPYHEKYDLNLFIELSKKSGTIVDIGANTGLFSVLASIVNSKAKIYSIEPYSINAGRMRVNLSLNSANNVKIYEIAIGENEGEINIAVPENKSITAVSSVNSNFSKSIYPDMLWGSQVVKIKRLDDFAKENEIKIDLIKCDVETYEMPVFNGAERVLLEDKPTIIFESFLNEERKLFFNNILKKYDYYAYIILEQGVVYLQEGFVNTANGINYLLTPVKPSKTFISYKNIEELAKGLLLRPTRAVS